MHTQCKSCNFWLSRDLVAQGCPNCGLSGHHKSAAEVRKALKAAETELSKLRCLANYGSGCWCPLSWHLLAALAMIAVAMVVGSIHLSNGIPVIDDMGLHLKMLGWAELAAIGIWWTHEIAGWLIFGPGVTEKEREIQGLRDELTALDEEAEGSRKWPRPCLRQDVQKIQTRLRQIEGDREQLRRQREMLLKEDPDKWTAALELIAATDIELVEWSDRERIALREIELARWVNALEANSLGIEELSVSECDERLARISRMTTKGRSLLDEWDGDDTVQPLRPEPETSLGMNALTKASDCRRQVAQGLSICQELRDGVHARRVVATVSAVGNQSATPTNEYVRRARKSLAELTARSEIGELRKSFRKLEDLAAHSSARREVDRLTAGLS